MKKYLFLLVVLVSFHSLLMAQIISPVKWSFELKPVNSNEVELIFKGNIDKGWHLYSTNLPDGGPIKTTFHFETDSTKVQFLGGINAKSTPIKEHDKIFNMDLEFFNDQAVFSQKVKVNSRPVIIRGTIEYQTCNDETCTLNESPFSFTINANDASVSSNAAPVADKITPVPENSLPAKDTIKVQPLADVTGVHHNLGWFLIFSFLAGLAAILTPCVFPMIPMTVSFFLSSNKSKLMARVQALFYGASIILIYTVIGTIVAVTFGADFANFLSTHWLPNILFFIIFVIFAFSFFGAFEIILPSSWVNKSDKAADTGGIGGAFFMALTLVLVSFSCTGPIVGAILVESAGGMVFKPIVGMLGFSLAFALPFTLFALFPQWLTKLPKSGGWLNSVKVFLGFIELALGLKFLSVADQTYHWGILDRDIYIAFWIVIFTMMGFYFLGKLKFAHDSDVKHVTVPRLMLSIITFTFVVYLIPGMFGAPLKAISGYLPPMTSHDFDLNRLIRDEIRMNKSGGISTTPDTISGCEKPKYTEFLELPHGLQGYFDFEQGLACAKARNKPIFIDFTGHGCVNCREMEANVWSDPRVLQKLQNDFVIIALYVDDKTNLPQSEWVTSTVDQRVKKTLGKKYADFQIARFGVNAQPYYVLLDLDQSLLTKPTARDLNPDHFLEFLDKGIAEYKKRHNL